MIQSPFKKLLKSQLYRLYLFYAYSLDEPSGISYIGWQHLTTYCPLEIHIEFKWDPREILLQSCAVPKILPSFTGCKPRWSHGDGFHSKGLLTQLGLGIWLPSIPSAKAAGFNVPFAKQRWLPPTAQLHLFPLHLSNEITKLWSGFPPGKTPDTMNIDLGQNIIEKSLLIFSEAKAGWVYTRLAQKKMPKSAHMHD